MLGQRLFAWGRQPLLEMDMKRLIQTQLSPLMLVEKLTEEAMLTARAKAVDDINALPEIGNLKEKREIELQYRSWKFKATVKSIEQQVELEMGSLVRGWLSEKGLIRSLPGEDEVCGETAGLKLAECEAALSSDADAAREWLWSNVRAEEGVKNGDQLKVRAT
eukprot:86700-Amphidinium_carterae.1